MAIRFFSADGARWSVWNVSGAGARLGGAPGEEWLCFMHDLDKRRLAPVPAGWANASEERLRGWLSRSKEARKPRSRAFEQDDEDTVWPPADKDNPASRIRIAPPASPGEVPAPLDQEVPLDHLPSSEHPSTAISRSTLKLRLKKQSDD